MVRSRERADPRRGAPERSRRGRASGSRGGRSGRRSGRGGRRPVADVLHALLLQAVAGPPARARPRRPARRRARDRVRLPSRHARAGRRRAGAARAGRGDGGRSRARAAGGPAARADPQQLLGQPRRDARALPGARLADAGLPPARASRPAGVPGDPRGGGRGRAADAGDRHRRLRHRHLCAHARADGPRLRASRVATRRLESGGGDAGAAGSRRRPRRGRLSPHARARPAGSRRAEPKGSSAPPVPTGQASRSRPRTVRAERTRRRSRRSSAGSASTCRTSPPGRFSTPVASGSARPSSLSEQLSGGADRRRCIHAAAVR